MTTTTVWTATQHRTPVRWALQDLRALGYHYYRLTTTTITGKDPKC